MLDPIDREEYETFLADLLKSGDKEKIAILSGVQPSAISQQLNPDRKDVYAWPFRNAQFLWATLHSNVKAADAMFERQCRDYLRWREQIVGPEDKAAKSTHADLTSTIGHQLFEFIESEQKGKARAVRRKELDDVRSAVERKIREIDAEDTERADAFNASGLREVEPVRKRASVGPTERAHR